jgi:phosphatidylserine decarboxylase
MADSQTRSISDELNFILTNRIPRVALTQFIGWFATIESRWLTKVSIAIWKLFADLDLSEAKKQEFNSLRDCFIRELRTGLRPIDPRPAVWTSPCDAIVGAHGRVQAQSLFQTKGMSYRLEDLLGDKALAQQLEGTHYVTLRLLSSMYHRFHAPADATLREVTYHSGDTWNVNPPALARVPSLFCRNERAVLQFAIEANPCALVMVPVAAVLVASMRIHAIDQQLNLSYRGPHRFTSHSVCHKGEELGWFEHGSTIILFAPANCSFYTTIQEGYRIRMGEALLCHPFDTKLSS